MATPLVVICHDLFGAELDQVTEALEIVGRKPRYLAGGIAELRCLVGRELADLAQHIVALRRRRLGVHTATSEQEPGELVCINRFPSQPLTFWQDDDNQQYHQSYFNHYEGVWRHGDWIEKTPEQGFILYGRSDATLNVAGIRIGSAEIYRYVNRIDAVLESVVVEYDDKKQSMLVLFVHLQTGLKLNQNIKNTIIDNSMFGSFTKYEGKKKELSFGDYSTKI